MKPLGVIAVLTPFGYEHHINLLLVASTFIEFDAIKELASAIKETSSDGHPVSLGKLGEIPIALCRCPGESQRIVAIQQQFKPVSVIFVGSVVDLDPNNRFYAPCLVAGNLHRPATSARPASNARPLLAVSFDKELSESLETASIEIKRGRSHAIIRFKRAEVLDIPPATDQSFPTSYFNFFHEISDREVSLIARNIDSRVALVACVVWHASPRNPEPKDYGKLIGTPKHREAATYAARLIKEAIGRLAATPVRSSPKPKTPPNGLQKKPLDLFREMHEHVWLVDEQPFFNRDQFRKNLERLLAPGMPRRMIVRGPEGSGKSHSYEYVRYLSKYGALEYKVAKVAQQNVGDPQKLTATSFLESLFRILGLPWDSGRDSDNYDPDEFVLRNLVEKMTTNCLEPTLIVVDGFDAKGMDPSVYMAINHIASLIDDRLRHLRLLLLGYEQRELIARSDESLIENTSLQPLPDHEVGSYLNRLSRQFGRSGATPEIQQQLLTEVREVDSSNLPPRMLYKFYRDRFHACTKRLIPSLANPHGS